MDIDIYEEVSIDTNFHLENNLNFNDMIEMITNDDYTVTFSINLEISDSYNSSAELNEMHEIQVTTEVSKEFLLNQLANYTQETEGTIANLKKLVANLREEIVSLKEQTNKPVDHLRPVG
jgi:hypothetical protein